MHTHGLYGQTVVVRLFVHRVPGTHSAGRMLGDEKMMSDDDRRVKKALTCGVSE